MKVSCATSVQPPTLRWLQVCGRVLFLHKTPAELDAPNGHDLLKEQPLLIRVAFSLLALCSPLRYLLYTIQMRDPHLNRV